MLFKNIAFLAAIGSAMSAAVVPDVRPEKEPMCDYYATKLFGENTGLNQYTLLNLIVNRFAFGNYKFPDGTPITGFLAPGHYKGKPVNLLPYFNGGLASTNQGGKHGVSVNILKLDAGGVFPVPEQTTPNGTNLNQNTHLKHVYPYFGQVLGCSKIGQEGYPEYDGPASVYEVHKFMWLGPLEVGYFINQIGLACKSFGFTQKDVDKAVDTFDKWFNYRCLPPQAIVAHQGLQYNSICQAPSCPLPKKGALCPTYQPPEPASTNFTVSFGQGSSLCTKKSCFGDGNEVKNFTNSSATFTPVADPYPKPTHYVYGRAAANFATKEMGMSLGVSGAIVAVGLLAVGL